MIPTSLLIGTQALSGVFGALGRRSQRKAAERYAKQVHKLSIEDASRQMAQLGSASEQTLAQASQVQRNIIRESALASGQVRSGAGAGGVGGAGINTLEQEFQKQALTRLAAQEASTQIALGNIRNQQAAAGAQAASRINQAYSQVPGKQSLLGTLLQIGGEALFTQAKFGGTN